MIEFLALALGAIPASDQAETASRAAPCPYGIDYFLGSWSVDPADEASVNDTSVIEFSISGGSRTWRQYLHYREVDQGRWLTSDQCGTATLLSPTGAIIVARFTVLGKNRIKLERSGQVYARSNTSGSGAGE